MAKKSIMGYKKKDMLLAKEIAQRFGVKLTGEPSYLQASYLFILQAEADRITEAATSIGRLIVEIEAENK